MATSPRAPRIVGIGGTTRANSSTERAVRLALAAAEAEGAEITMLGPDALLLPHYAPEKPERDEMMQRLIATLRAADGVILGSPGYHGGISGMMKNALDYIEDMRGDERPYLSGRAVGCIVSAAGWQAGVTTLTALRSVVHALRGWPTPLGVCFNTTEKVFDESGRPNEQLTAQLNIVAREVTAFARAQIALGV
jgi:FMN reductase